VRVESLHIYPIKSARVLDVNQARVQPWGLAGDRRWAVVDEAGNRIAAWKYPALLRAVADPTPDGLQLHGPGWPLFVPFPDPAVRMPVSHTRLDTAALAGPQASDWFSELLGRPARLVWLDDPRLRPVSQAHGGEPGDALTLADAGPVLLTSVASLAQLNDWIAETAAARGEPGPGLIPMSRFRPNVVIDGELPFAEDGWSRLRLGSVEFRFGELCDRCVMTTIDQDDLSRGQEPMRTLARRRRWSGQTWFGVRLIPVSSGVLGVGDAVQALPGP
jgi:uncharacterized protein YcbX